MAWVDDRIWCHPKFTDLSAQAFRAYIQSLAYASGMNTRGRLTRPQQTLVGADESVRAELVQARLWDKEKTGTVSVHDWDEHNGKRDERRAVDRERKRLARAKASARPSAGQSQGTSAGQSAGRPHVEGSEGSDGSEGSEGKKEPVPVTVPHTPEQVQAGSIDFNTILKDMPQ